MLLPLLIASHALAATITANPGDNLQAKLDAAANGTLQLAPGNYTIIQTLNLHTNTTITGAPNLASHLLFNLPGGDNALYAFQLDQSAANVTVQGLDIVSNHGLFKLSHGTYNAIHITANNLQFAGGQQTDGTLVFGIFQSVPCNDLEICWNYFHDSPNSVRNWELWFPSHCHLDHNLSYNIQDGGHLLYPNNTTFSWNYVSNLHRMGQEIQADKGQNLSGLTLDHDVFFDWWQAYNDSEGMSVCPSTVTNVIVTNCYCRQSFVTGAGWGKSTATPPGGPNRFGYAFESIAPGILFTNDTMILSNTSASAIASGEDTTVNNCTVFGGSNAIWGVWAGDFGPNGKQGTFNLGTGPFANTVNNALTNAPPPPSNTFAGPAIYAATSNGTLWSPAVNTATPQQHAAIPANTPNSLTGLSTTPSASTIAFAWTDPLTNITIHTFTPTADCGTLLLTGPATSASLMNLNAGWEYTTTISGSENGQPLTATATYTTLGHSPDGTTPTLAELSTPATAPTLVHSIQTFSDGTIIVDGTK